MKTRHRRISRVHPGVIIAVAIAMALGRSLAEVAGPPAAQAGNAAGIVPKPGLTVTINVYGGTDSAGNPLGDYQNIYTFTNVAAGGYRFNYQFTDPHRFHGMMGVAAGDVR